MAEWSSDHETQNTNEWLCVHGARQAGGDPGSRLLAPRPDLRLLAAIKTIIRTGSSRSLSSSSIWIYYVHNHLTEQRNLKSSISLRVTLLIILYPWNFQISLLFSNSRPRPWDRRDMGLLILQPGHHRPVMYSNAQYCTVHCTQIPAIQFIWSELPDPGLGH